ncbi:putative phosphoribosyl transferase [Nitratiruptor sp. YY08-26]|uniref:phosphoribosyltransferase n=1 Tax=unclassified Nitratiruptor TaxID=2624044 RepID=UPI0019160287|nr:MULTISPECIES: phosphoribosyltransferase family protein [unclassified Nitratiruptor]BCD61238.1 putative phosphoribosyl transferase [Nitratiruptor sp. YY08-13]BCD65171.1 putative phosphoribosyl transferase [Nitratiruptor sp. YY08-26]
MVFSDRFEAGELLAKELQEYREDPNTVVIALPRGGVPVAYVIAKQLDLPLDIFFVKKIPSPYNPEAAIGAISENGEEFVNERAVIMLNVARHYIDEQEAQILEKIRQKRALYNKPRIDIKGKRVILVDDGVATGASMYLAAKALKNEGAKEVVIAVPVAPPDSIALLKEAADKVIVLDAPADFMAVGQFYRDFHQLSDDEVMELLSEF